MEQSSGGLNTSPSAHPPCHLCADVAAEENLLCTSSHSPVLNSSDLFFTSSTTARFGAESVKAKGKLEHITQSADKGKGHDLLFPM